MKNKAVCLSMTQKSIEQLKEIHEKTGKSKSRIVRDAIEKEHRKINE